MNENKLNKIEKNIFMITSSIAIYIILFLIKDFILSFVNISDTNNIYINIEYQIFIIGLTLIYILQTKNKENYKNIFKNILIGIFTIITYFFLSIIKTPILNLFGINSNSNQLLKSISLILYLIFILILLILINIKSIKEDIKDIKKNHKKYFSKYIKYWFFATIIMMFSNLIINFLNGGNIASNEQSIRESFKTAPIYIIFASVIFAPISEELVFRKGLRNIISSPIIFILVSGLIFGGLHVVGNINSWIDILYLIPYSVHGLVFAYILYKTDNVLVPMGIHLMHNGIMMSLETLLFILGVL